MKTATTPETASNYILRTSREYSIYICESRAIPNFCDGLKDVQRKALWMLKNKSEKIKTISLAGEMISSNLYLHGDVSAADAISKLAAPFLNNIPLIEGIGTFGTRVAPVDGIGAPRYTYVKKNSHTEKLIFPDVDIIPMKENYDGSNSEPENFLPIIPLLLLNGVSGIAVGWSTEILPRKISDIIRECKNALLEKEVNDIPPHYNYLNLNIKNIEGSTWEFTGKIIKNDTSSLRVVELPPDLSLEKFKEKLNTLEDDDKIQGYTDNSTKSISIDVKFLRGTIKDIDEETLITLLKLKQRKTERIVVIDETGKSITTFKSAKEVIEKFVKWRLKWYRTRYENLMKNEEKELLWYKSLEKCFEQKLADKIKNIPNRQELLTTIKTITVELDTPPNMCERIAALPLYRWTDENIVDIKNGIQTSIDKIVEFKRILSDEKILRDIYVKELSDLEKVKW